MRRHRGAEPAHRPAPAGTGAASAGHAGRRNAGRRGGSADEDPYEGIAPEDLPPDLQYGADSSVSFPTNI